MNSLGARVPFQINSLDELKEPLQAGSHCELEVQEDLDEIEPEKEKIFSALLEKCPQVIQTGRNIKNASGQPVFKTMSHLLSFLLVPVLSCTYNGNGEKLPYQLDCSQKKERKWLEELNALEMLCQNQDNEKLFDYLMALRKMCVKFSKLTNLQMDKHPKEIAFSYHYSSSQSSKLTEVALILSIPAKSDNSNAFGIPDGGNKKLHRTISGLFKP